LHAPNFVAALRRAQHRDHVWSYDFVEDRTHDGRWYRVLNVLDEFTHECLAIRVAGPLKFFVCDRLLTKLKPRMFGPS
jgi:transposase InsO family protein